MCFRPPDAAKSVRCPSCNMLNPSTLEKCRKCKTELPKQDDEEKEKTNE
ncbi:hypothetical protein LPY66_10690 [Dehalobacter sp. DCM]|nr:hypothetical protein LPY66_10690 [Dehalobacter sp. DCM]